MTAKRGTAPWMLQAVLRTQRRAVHRSPGMSCQRSRLLHRNERRAAQGLSGSASLRSNSCTRSPPSRCSLHNARLITGHFFISIASKNAELNRNQKHVCTGSTENTQTGAKCVRTHNTFPLKSDKIICD